jgi:hypothetical protein
MTEPDAPAIYREPGSSWWPVAWGPIFAAVGALVEALTGPVHGFAWLVVALVMAGAAAIWVNARRKLCSVLLTRETLRQGNEELPVSRIVAVGDEVGTSMGARVLGGSWTVPRKLEGVPMKLDDGTDVLGWAKDGEALRTALRETIDA